MFVIYSIRSLHYVKIVNSGMNEAESGDIDACFTPTDLGISLPGHQTLTLPALLSFLKSECPPSLLELLKNDAVVLLECR